MVTVWTLIGDGKGLIIFKHFLPRRWRSRLETLVVRIQAMLLRSHLTEAIRSFIFLSFLGGPLLQTP